MKILIFTQKVDINDSMLSFFHRWIVELSKHFESVLVICLYKGECNLPNNVRVLSLGKESGESRYKYIKNFYRYIWEERNNYDKVFVHMNQEYILLGGIFWKILGKSVYMWRNHHSGSYLTDLAAVLCDKIFCTSKFSYTARYEETVLMPVGVDINAFLNNGADERMSKSILSLGRIAPSKNIDILIKAIKEINRSDITVNIYGSALDKDIEYYNFLKKEAGDTVKFHEGIPNSDTPKIYGNHEIFVNLSSSGMYDKTIFEAMASGCLVLVSNENLRGQVDDMFIFKYRDINEFKTKLLNLISLDQDTKKRKVEELITFAKSHSLDNLVIKLVDNMK